VEASASLIEIIRHQREDENVYGFIMRAQEPIDVYNALHKEVMAIVGSNDPEGLFVHTAYATATGYVMVEVWESKEQADAFNRDIVSQAFHRLAIPADGPPPDLTEFEPVEVITPRIHTPTNGA
jgi:hypothetical protein